jgi:hypothetical protein
MSADEDLEEKKLLGSGGYAFAKLTEQEELRANLVISEADFALLSSIYYFTGTMF